MRFSGFGVERDFLSIFLNSCFELHGVWTNCSVKLVDTVLELDKAISRFQFKPI